jgi:hypothetical protein
MVTKGHRRLGRTIRILENSVELSPKESLAKEDENKTKSNMRTDHFSEDSPVQSPRDIVARKNKKEN